jgi:hypothetical protein
MSLSMKELDLDLYKSIKLVVGFLDPALEGTVLEGDQAK